MKKILGFSTTLATAMMLMAIVATAQPQIGDVMGDVLHTDIRVVVDGTPLASYNLGGTTYVVATRLRAHGFEVHFDEAARRVDITRGISVEQPQNVPANTQPIGSVAFPFFYTDIVTYVNGQRVSSFNIGGSTVVRITEVMTAAGADWHFDAELRRVIVSTVISDPAEFEAGMFELINRERARAGLSPVVIDAELAELARLRAQNNMSTGGTLDLRASHHGSFSANNISPAFYMRQFLNLPDSHLNILHPDAVSVGIGTNLGEGNTDITNRFDLVVFFQTADGQLPTAANPNTVTNLQLFDRLPQSNIILPTTRVTTPAERNAWIAEYRAMGGANAFEMEVVRLVNEFRVSRGLSYLTFDPTLAMAARYYSQLLVNMGFVTVPVAERISGVNDAHSRGPHGGSTATARSFGSVIIWGGNAFTPSPAANTPQSVVQGWIDSPGHFTYLVSPNHRYIGAGLTLRHDNRAFNYLFMSPNPSVPNY